MSQPPRSGKELFDYLKKLVTESANPSSIDLDRLDAIEILELINTEDAKVALIVRGEIPKIATAVEMVRHSLAQGGRLIYMGAGTSGRLGVLDAAECPPTFGTPPDMIIGLIAGGPSSLIRSAEGVEDRSDAGVEDIEAVGVSEKDTVIGLTASQRTPYVIGGLDRALSKNAKTVLICCNPLLEKYPYHLIINPVVGPEVLTGSTRMKAALAEKMILTMISTTAMVRLGKVYRNMMVDLQATSQKLIERSKRVITNALACDYETAAHLLLKAEGSVKAAIVMGSLNCDLPTAKTRLKLAGGFVHRAIDPDFR